MEKLKELSAFFPAYNEESNIGKVLAQSLTVFSQVADCFEIIVIDDGSSDQTRAIVESWAAKYPNIRCLSHSENRGYGAALKSGFSASKFDNIFLSDGDGQFDLAEISELLKPYKEDVAAVIGYRKKRSDPIYRRLNTYLYHKLMKSFLGLNFKDLDCAFKLLRAPALKNLTLQSEGALVSAELLYKMQQKGLLIIEIPVSHYPRLAGKPTGARLSVILKMFRELYKLYKQLKKSA